METPITRFSRQRKMWNSHPAPSRRYCQILAFIAILCITFLIITMIVLVTYMKSLRRTSGDLPPPFHGDLPVVPNAPLADEEENNHHQGAWISLLNPLNVNGDTIV